MSFDDVGRQLVPLRYDSVAEEVLAYVQTRSLFLELELLASDVVVVSTSWRRPLKSIFSLPVSSLYVSIRSLILRFSNEVKRSPSPLTFDLVQAPLSDI